MATAEQRSDAIVEGLRAIKPDHIFYLPSSTLKQVLEELAVTDGARLYPLTREEEGIGIAAGLALTGARPVLVIQDNGVGNALTALTTFPQAYHIPILLLVSQRGGLGEYNSMIHTFCEHVEAVLQGAQLRYFKLDGRVPLAEWAPTVVQAHRYMQTTHRPVVVLCNLMAGQ